MDTILFVALLAVVFIIALSSGRKPTTRQRRLPIQATGALGLTCWVASGAIYEHYANTRPRTPHPAAGRMYRIINHGDVAYLTLREYAQIKGLWVAAAMCITVGALLALKFAPEEVEGRWLQNRRRAAATVVVVGILISFLLAVVPL